MDWPRALFPVFTGGWRQVGVIPAHLIVGPLQGPAVGYSNHQARRN